MRGPGCQAAKCGKFLRLRDAVLDRFQVFDGGLGEIDQVNQFTSKKIQLPERKRPQEEHGAKNNAQPESCDNRRNVGVEIAKQSNQRQRKNGEHGDARSVDALIQFAIGARFFHRAARQGHNSRQ